MASTEQVDSYGTVLKASGWDLSRFNANPVLLYVHDSFSRLPVGHCENVRVEADELLFDAVFDDTSAFDNEVWQKYQKGVIRGFSVRFDPVESCIEKQGGRDVVIYTKQILMEISCAPVPSNAGALRRSANSGMEKAMRRSEMMKMLREAAEGDGPEEEKKLAGELYEKMGGEDGEEKAREDEDEDDEEEAPASSSAKPGKGNEEGRAPARTAGGAAPSGELDLALRVAALEAGRQRSQVRALVEKNLDRIPPSLRSWASRQSLGTLKDYLAQAPKAEIKTPALGAAATRGKDQGAAAAGTTRELPSGDADKLDRILGITPPANELGFGAFDPNEGAKPFRTAGPTDIARIQSERRAPRRVG